CSWSEYFIASIAVMSLAALAFFVIRSGRASTRPRKATIWFLVALVSFFMMTPLSRPVWQLLPSLQKIKFPFPFSHTIGRSRRVFIAALMIFSSISIYALAQRAYFSYPSHYVDQSIIELWNN